MSLYACNPALILRLRFAMEARLSGAPSASGPQIDQLSEGRGRIAPSSTGGLHAIYGDLILLTKDLNETELKVCRLRYDTPIGTESYEHLIGLSSLPDALRWQGESYAGKLKANPDLVKVSGQRTRYPSEMQIGEALGLTARQVRSHLSRAADKVRTAQKWRGFMEHQEEGA